MHGSILFISNISFDVTVDALKDLFSGFGGIHNIKLFKDKGFCFVEMEKQADAEQAMKSLNGTDFHGRSLRISPAHTGKKKRKR